MWTDVDVDMGGGGEGEEDFTTSIYGQGSTPETQCRVDRNVLGIR